MTTTLSLHRRRQSGFAIIEILFATGLAAAFCLMALGLLSDRDFATYKPAAYALGVVVGLVLIAMLVALAREMILYYGGTRNRKASVTSKTPIYTVLIDSAPSQARISDR